MVNQNGSQIFACYSPDIAHLSLGGTSQVLDFIWSGFPKNPEPSCKSGREELATLWRHWAWLFKQGTAHTPPLPPAPRNDGNVVKPYPRYLSVELLPTFLHLNIPTHLFQPSFQLTFFHRTMSSLLAEHRQEAPLEHVSNYFVSR